MSTIDELHPKAMDIAEQAFHLRSKGREEEAKRLFLEALEIEQQAAFLLPLTQESEPSRSILFRRELKNLYEDVNFMRHLSARGIELSSREWLMTIYGDAISYGKATTEILMTRVDRITALYYRTVERLFKLPYRIKGGVNPEIKEKYELYISALLPSSFAVTFQVGIPDPQIPLFPELEPREPIKPELVIDEVMSCFEILESTNPGDLKEKIKDETYYENFIGLAKQIAPDGEKVKFVGFTVKKNGIEKPIALRKSKKQLQETSDLILREESIDEKLIKKSYTGILMHAHSPRIRKFGTVQLIDSSTGEVQSIHVPIALMKDVVQPYYEENVIVLVSEKKGKNYLEEIDLQKI